jgi:hyaluronoglucosaminidase
MPQIKSDGTVVNGGIPQLGNLTLHLEKFNRDFAAEVPDPKYRGYCLLDFEFWRADWNSTPDAYRNASIVNAAGDVHKAQLEYEAGAKAFLLGTMEAARALRPGCKLGCYGYPRNNLPAHAKSTPAWKKYCDAHPFDCSFAGYGNTTAGDAQRALNDQLGWLWQASDALFPSVYLGVLPNQSDTHTAAKNLVYVQETVKEAIRLATSASAMATKKPEVMAVTWYLYDNYPRTTVWYYLSSADLHTQLHGAVQAGADGLMLWGAIDNSTTTTVALQAYVTDTLGPEVTKICGEFGCNLASSSTD